MYFELSSNFGGWHAKSTCMREVFTRLERLAATEIAVTLVGETGTGKSSLARALHDASERAESPFVSLDCGAFDPESVALELFGEAGDISPAASREAALEQAHGGTLFLDAIGELSLAAQARLLQVFEKGSMQRGGVERPVDVRIISATTQDLRTRVAAGQLREDLYFRLTEAVVAIPPLRARFEDLPCILPELLATLGRPSLKVADDMYAALSSQSWPGNVRQLRNTLAAGVSLVDQGALEVGHLRFTTAEEGVPALDNLPLAGFALADIERAAIKQTLALSGGTKARAAQTLGIAVSTLYDKVKKYGL